MGKRLFFILPVLFIFSLLFVQVSEATPIPSGTYEVTITQIGFYSTVPTQEGQAPDSDTIINLSPTRKVHEDWVTGEGRYTDFVYLGNIKDGTYYGMGLYAESSTPPLSGVPGWGWVPFDNRQNPSAKTFTESDRKSITISVENGFATVVNL